ncbi:hypothetical protein ACN38_g1044 [Penicillium nordicum]|uniref:Uncharacterized protein n=1 Tax=Penicillium nordicum TaxID=229535 RepID=A0A0M9WK59_9EURO|nr:hypothetical protein ACN38_g1044 [Penicillium nordicum]
MGAKFPCPCSQPPTRSCQKRYVYLLTSLHKNQYSLSIAHVTSFSWSASLVSRAGRDLTQKPYHRIAIAHCIV